LPPASTPERARTTAADLEAAATSLTAEGSHDDVRARLATRTDELVEQLRSDVQLRAVGLRALLKLEIALQHPNLRSQPASDPRVQALSAARDHLHQALDTSSLTLTPRGALEGYGSAAQDVWSNGIMASVRKREVDGARIATSVGIVAGGLALASATWHGLKGIFGGGSSGGIRGSFLGRLGRRFMIPVLTVLGFLGLGSLASARATMQANSGSTETRTPTFEPTAREARLSGLHFVREGGEVRLQREGVTYGLDFASVSSTPPPPGADVSFGRMLERFYTSPSTAGGLGVEQPSLRGTVALGNAPAFFLSDATLGNLRTALNTPAADTPDGTNVDVPMRFALASMNGEQLAFVRRCIARGYPLTMTDDGSLVVTTQVRVRRASAPPAPEVLPALPLFSGALGTLAVGSHRFAVPRGTVISMRGAGDTTQTLGSTAGASLNLHAKVQLVRINDLSVRVSIDEGAPPSTTYTLQTGSGTTTTSVSFATPEAPRPTPAPVPLPVPAPAPDTTESPEAQTVRKLGEATTFTHIDTLAAAQAAAATNGLSTHTGTPDSHTSISAAFTAINALVPAEQRTSTAVATCLATLLDKPSSSPVRSRTFTTASGRYALRAHEGQLRFEALPAVAPALTLNVLTEKIQTLTKGKAYHLAFPAGATGVMVEEDGGDASAMLTAEGGWKESVGEPVTLRRVTQADKTYLELTPATKHGLKITFQTEPVQVFGPYPVSAR
jgi:hypothetical protein